MGFAVRKNAEGLYGLVEIPTPERPAPRMLKSFDEERETGEAFLARWREQGGYEGALARQTTPFRPVSTLAVPGHMPFPGHRHMGETG